MRNNEIHDLFSIKKAIEIFFLLNNTLLNHAEKTLLSEIIEKINALETSLSKQSENYESLLSGKTNAEREKIIAENLVSAHNLVLDTTHAILSDLHIQLEIDAAEASEMMKIDPPFDLHLLFLNRDPTDAEKLSVLSLNSFCIIEKDKAFYIGYVGADNQYTETALTPNSTLAKELAKSDHLNFNSRYSRKFADALLVMDTVKKLNGKIPDRIPKLFKYICVCAHLVQSFSQDKIKKISEQNYHLLPLQPKAQLPKHLSALLGVPMIPQRAGFSPLGSMKWYSTKNNTMMPFGGTAGGICHGIAFDVARRIKENLPPKIFYVLSKEIIKNQLIQPKRENLKTLASDHLDMLTILKSVTQTLDEDTKGIYALQVKDTDENIGHELLFRKLPNNMGYEFVENTFGTFYFKTKEDMQSWVSLQLELTYRHKNFFISAASIEKIGSQPENQPELQSLLEKLRLSPYATPEEIAEAEKLVVANIINHCEGLCKHAENLLKSTELSGNISDAMRERLETMQSSFRVAIIAGAPYLSDDSLKKIFDNTLIPIPDWKTNILFQSYSEGKLQYIDDEVSKKQIISTLKTECLYYRLSSQQLTYTDLVQFYRKAREYGCDPEDIKFFINQLYSHVIGYRKNNPPIQDEDGKPFLFSGQCVVINQVVVEQNLRNAVLSAAEKYLERKRGASSFFHDPQTSGSRLTKELKEIFSNKEISFLEIMQALKNYFCPGIGTRPPNKNDDSFSNFLLREFAYYKFVGLDLFDEISIRTNLEISPIQNEEKSTIDERKDLFKFFEKLTVSKSFKPFV